MRRRALGVAAATGWAHVLAGCASPAVSSDVQAALAPGAMLRAAINFGNPVLAGRRPGTGEPIGVSVDLAHELGRRLGVPVSLVTFDAAGQVTAALRNAQVDLAFVAIDPLRGADMLYSPPYLIIEGAFLVREDSPIRRNEDVDQPGNRVAVGRGNTYDLQLSRELKVASLVRAPTSQAATELLVTQQLEAAAGVRQQLQAVARRTPGLRVLDGRFAVVEQALAIPRAREAGLAYLRRFIEAMKASGFVADSLARHGVEGAAVAPAARL